MKPTSSNQSRRTISTAMRAIDVWTAILLLSGQITTSGVFFSGGSIWFSLTGPIFGNVRTEGTNPTAGGLLDGIDVILAMLLILGQITNTGPWISSGVFNMVVSGPALGYNTVPVPVGGAPTSSTAKHFFADLRSLVIEREIKAGQE